MKICTIGLGYIGLPTSIMFAKHNVEVVGVDNNPDVIESLNTGNIHIEEPGLQEELNKVLLSKNFRASNLPEQSDVFIIAVPTPNNDDDYKSCDLSYVLSAINGVLPHLEKGNVLIVESTISPGTMEKIIKPLLEEAGFEIGEDLFLVYCPERVLPGKILHELVNNNRLVGGVTSKCAEYGEMIYRAFVKGEVVKTEAKTAEMSKLMENTYRDVNIALANELTKVCNELEIDSLEVIKMANKHPRVNIHSPGPGVGGHCLAVDPYFIVSKSPQTANLIHLSRSVNNSMPYYVVENINKLMEQIEGKVVTLLGLTYKGNIGDIRESPALKIMEILQYEKNYEVRAYDPYVSKELGITFSNIEDSLHSSDLAVVLTDHDLFKEIDRDKFIGMNTKRIFDTKNVIQNKNLNCEYINFGNLFKSLQKDTISV